jgi:glycosyltransferase involved in cell wall biosynthesis
VRPPGWLALASTEWIMFQKRAGGTKTPSPWIKVNVNGIESATTYSLPAHPTPKKKRVLISHPNVGPRGGSNAVAAWTLQALREEFDVTLATSRPIDFESVNQSFGTSLRDGDFAVRKAPRYYRIALRCLPVQGALMEACMLMRWAQTVARQEHFDVIMSTQNEADFNRRSIQYVHYPWVYMPRPEIEMRWFHRIPGFLALYRGACARLARCSNEGLRRNLSLANSSFVAGKIKQAHGTQAKILYPPVPGVFPPIPWEQRRRAVVAVGRMGAIKRWEMAIDIVDRVRRNGFDLGLTLICHRDDPEYGRRIAALAESRPWFRILYELSREQLVGEVAHHRYGIHTMENEHFGIGPAEILRAGCIVFVHNSGGAAEIVAHRPELTFSDAAEGAEKLADAVNDPLRERELRTFVDSRRDCFSTERFCDGLREVVRNFE